MNVVRTELVGGEGVIYLATRVSRKVGGPEEIIKELNDKSRVRKLLENIVKAGHFSVLEHSLIRIWVKGDWNDIVRSLFHYKYVEASRSEDEVIISMNPRTAIEMMADSSVKPLAIEALRTLPLISDILGLKTSGRPNLEVKLEKASENPPVYVFIKSPFEDPRHGFYAFWTEMSRVASHQFVRHRRLSFTQRSGRYTKPNGFVFPKVSSEALDVMKRQAESSYRAYMKLLEMGIRREDARYILPAALKTALFVSGRQSDWIHFLELRTDIHAQEEIRNFAFRVAEVMEWKRVSDASRVLRYKKIE